VDGKALVELPVSAACACPSRRSLTHSLVPRPGAQGLGEVPLDASMMSAYVQQVGGLFSSSMELFSGARAQRRAKVPGL
jgi:hypothetical protein